MVCMFFGEGRGWWRDLVERCVEGACALWAWGLFEKDFQREEVGGVRGLSGWKVKRVSSRIVIPCL